MKIIELKPILRLTSVQSFENFKGKAIARNKDGIQQNVSAQSIRTMGWTVLSLLILLTGCGNRENLLKEISDFNKSVQTGTESIAAYYTNLNDQQLKLYLMLLELNPNCEVGDEIDYKCIDPNWQSQGKNVPASPLAKLPIPLESIQARTSLLQELAAYSTSLAALAGDDSPEKFKGNITTLKDRLISLENKFQKLQDNSKDNSPDSKNDQKYLTPISKIIGILGKLILQEAQWNEIRNSIKEAETPVNTVLDTVAADLDAYAYPIIVTGANERYSLLIDYYNNNRLQFTTQEKRAAFLTKILEYRTAYNLALINKPSKIPNDLKAAHISLVNIAKSDGSPKDIAELRAWLERFKDDAEQLKIAVEQLAELKGES
jgi:hypothetical protein